MKNGYPIVLAVAGIIVAGIRPVRAADRLPDEAAVRAFLASDAFNTQTAGGWWKQEQEGPGRQSERLFHFDFTADSAGSGTVTYLTGRVWRGKGSTPESVLSLTLSPEGRLQLSAIRLTIGREFLSAAIEPLADGKWQVNLYLAGKASTHTVANRAEALDVIRSQSSVLGATLAVGDSADSLRAPVSPGTWKISTSTVATEG